MSGKEFKKKEIKFEMKIVALLSIDDFNELKEKILKTIRNKLQYSFDYIENKIVEEGSFAFQPINMWCYCKGRFSEYNGISLEDKDFMNGEIATFRKSHLAAFNIEQSKKIDDIYYKMEKEVYDTFNSSKIILESNYFKNKILKKGAQNSVN